MAKSRRDSEAAYRARKLERKLREQANRERGNKQRAVAIVLAVVASIAIAVVVPGVLRGRKTSDAEKRVAIDAVRPVADFGIGVEAADCGADTLDPPQASWTKHIKGSWQYDAAPPAGGPHSGTTLPTGKDHFLARSDQPVPERAVHDLEHGLVVAWYDTSLPDAEVAALKQAAAAAGDKKLRFVAVPWDRQIFAGDKHFVLTAWGVSRPCARVSGQVIAEFVAAHADAPGLAERTFAV